MVKPLAGLRVVDLTRFVSGAYSTMVLDALGADVLKIEGLPYGDPYRAQGAVQVGDQSALFASLNAGKRSVAVDLRSTDGQALVRTLAAGADIFVENARPGSLARSGLDYETVRATNPRLVYASISAYGQDGPDASRGGFDLILQAASGLMSVTGSTASGPVKVGVPVLDIGSGISAVAAILAGVLARNVDGAGRHVSSSLLEFALSAFTSFSADVLETASSPGLLGSHSPQFAPYGVFRCDGGAIALAGAGNEELWTRLCDVLGRPEWTSDTRFATNADRVANRDQLTELIEQKLAEHRTSQWLDVFDAVGVPASEVSSLSGALTSPQAAALGSIQELTTPQGYPYRTVRPPLHIDAPLDYSRGAPALGADTAAVLREAGLTDAEIAELVDRGVVST